MIVRVENKPRQTVEVTPDAKAALEAMAQWTSLPQRIVLERIVKWVAGQDKAVQGIILSSVPKEFIPDLARAILSKIAGEEKPDDEAKKDQASKDGTTGGMTKAAIKSADLPEKKLPRLAAKMVPPTHVSKTPGGARGSAGKPRE